MTYTLMCGELMHVLPFRPQQSAPVAGNYIVCLLLNVQI